MTQQRCHSGPKQKVAFLRDLLLVKTRSPKNVSNTAEVAQNLAGA